MAHLRRLRAREVRLERGMRSPLIESTTPTFGRQPHGVALGPVAEVVEAREAHVKGRHVLEC
jgi:hypothetical protein